jgi:hypothetical protein
MREFSTLFNGDRVDRTGARQKKKDTLSKRTM